MNTSIAVRYDPARSEFIILVLEGRRAMQRNVIKRKSGRGAQMEDFFEAQGVDVNEITTTAEEMTELIPGIELPAPPGRKKPGKQSDPENFI